MWPSGLCDELQIQQTWVRVNTIAACKESLERVLIKITCSFCPSCLT